MYEDKSVPFHINWKSLLIKLSILLVIVFIVLFLISIFNRDEAKKSNFGTNLSAMRDAATEYFVGSRLPKKVNDSEIITLEEMFEQNLLVEFADENGNLCDTESSYAEVTKIDDENYRLEVTLVCKNDNDTIVNTIKRTVENEDENKGQEEAEVVEDDEEELIEKEEIPADNPNNDLKPNTDNTSNNNSTNGQNTNTNVGQDTSVNTSTDTNVVTNTCSYGKKEYATIYPLAYLIDGNCAVGSLYTYANEANDIYLKEYQKLVQEMYQLNPDIVVKGHDGSDSYIVPVMNKDKTGYVGYQMFFKAVIKNVYSEKTVYAYYLDLSGNRKVIIDNRNNF